MDPSNVALVALVALVAWQLSRMLLGKVAPEKAKALVADGATLVDVRTPAEHAGGHIPGSKNIPVQEVARRVDEIGDKAKPVIVYCASGVRSASAAKTLRAAGFAEVHDLGSVGRWPG
jgi:phage shock protein E